MKPIKLLGIILIIAGVLALAYGGFTYTQDEKKAQIGPLELSVKDQERVNIPVWAGVGAALLGAVLLVTGGRKV
jgi:uncharacterized membrane protein YidH (DUF202 family)